MLGIFQQFKNQEHLVLTPVQQWAAGNWNEAVGNLWPVEKSTFSVAANDSSEAIRVYGISIGATDSMVAMVYIEDDLGNPLVSDRAWIRLVTQVSTPPTANIFLPVSAEYPGVFLGTLDFSSVSGPSSYAELTVDNNPGASNLEVKQIQLYRQQPTDFRNPATLSFDNPSTIYAENYDGLLDVSVPMFATTGNEYATYQCRNYDTTGNAHGGGLGSVLEDVFYSRRSGDSDFAPVRRLTDTGLNEFAIEDDTWAAHLGHNVHGGQARRQDPVFRVDNVVQPFGTRGRYSGTKIEWLEFTEIYDYDTPATVAANLDTTKTWENGALTLKQDITFLQAYNLTSMYMFMLSLYRNLDNDNTLGYIVDTFTMPNQANAEYTPGGGVDETYPNETRFIGTNNTLGFQFDVEVLSTTIADYRSWIQTGGSSRKFYLSPIGVRDEFGILAERIPRPVAVNDTFTLETKVTISKV